MYGVDGLSETVTVSSVVVAAGVVTFNFSAGLTNAYAVNSTIAWQFLDTASYNNANVTYDRCYFEGAVSGFNAYKGARNYWHDFIDCSFTGDSSVGDPTSADRWAVVLNDCYLYNFLAKTTLTYGGIYCSTAHSFARFQNITGESFSTGITPGTIDQPMISLESPAKIDIGTIQGYDSTGSHTAPIVQVRPLNWSPSNVLIQHVGTRNANSNPVDGPATVLFAGVSPDASSNPIDNPPWQYGALGYAGDRLMGFHMSHRRAGGPSAVISPNLVSAVATGWLDTGTGATSHAITGKTDPFGNTNAAYVRAGNAAPNNMAGAQWQPVVTISRTFAIGDIILWGCWVRVATTAADISPSADAVSTKFGIPNTGIYPVEVGVVDAASAPYATATNATIRDWTANTIGWNASDKGNNGDWHWAHGYGYVSAIAGGGGAYIQMRFADSVSIRMVVAYPVILHLSGPSEAEARMILESLSAYSADAPVGSLGMPNAPMHVPTYAAAQVPTPASGMVGPFVDIADGNLKFRNSAGTLKTVTLT
jgi:hypothetical protein